jgi:hypothetical protein
MLKIIALFLAVTAFGQAVITYTAAQPPQAAKPATLVVPSTVGTCTVTGDAIPAVNLIVNCTFGSIKDNRTVGPFTAGTALTVQYNAGGHAVTIIANAMILPINVTASLDASAPVGGVF